MFRPSFQARGGWALLAPLLLSGCFASQKDFDRLNSDFYKLQSRYQRSQEQYRKDRIAQRQAQEQEFHKLDAKLAEVSRTLDELNHAARKTGADLGVELDQAQQQIAQLRGHLDELDHKLSLDEPTLQKDDQQLQQLAAQIQKAQAAADHPTDPGAWYELALQKLNRGDPDGARQMFATFLQKWKADPLAPNAQYWLGETFYAERRYNDAILAFKQVVQGFPHSEKAPDALVKIGMSFAAQGQCRSAKPFFEEVLASYRHTPAGQIARGKLAQCRHHRR